MARRTVVVHGGTDSKPEQSDGCERAADAALAALQRGEDALAAAVAAVEQLERDGRYGAGVGSPLAMDGSTIQMDAGIMDNRGRLGAVAAVEQVTHAVRVARHVADTPHCLLVGDGATDFAMRLGLFAPVQPNERVMREFAEYVQKLRRAGPPHGDADDTESDEGRALVKHFWNYRTPWQQVMDEHGHGTVGCVVFDGEGHFAAATSTGGSMPALRGRVADIGQVGCGFYAGDAAAVACSGIGEHNVRHHTALRAHDWLHGGMPLKQALQEAVDQTPPGLQSALIGVTRDGGEVVARQPLASAVRHA